MRKLFGRLVLLLSGATVLAGAALLAMYFFGSKVGINPPREVLFIGLLGAIVGCLVYAIPRSGRTWAAWIVLLALSAGVAALGQTADRWWPTVAQSTATQKAGEWIAVLMSKMRSSDPVSNELPDDVPRATPVVQDNPSGGNDSAKTAGATDSKVKPSPTTDSKSADAVAKKPTGDKPSGDMVPGEDAKEITSAEFMSDHIEPALKAISAYEGYVCTFEKREWAPPLIGNPRLTNEQATLKIRHDRFAVCLVFSKPFFKEAIYGEGLHGGMVVAHSNESFISKLAGVVRAPPSDPKIMANNRYPITNIGMKNLMLKFKKESEQYKDSLKDVAFSLVKDQEIDKRPCKVIELWNSKPENYPRASARLYIDKEWNVPTGFESYELMDGKTKLVEYYRYKNVKFNPGLKDNDFDPANPAYKYP